MLFKKTHKYRAKAMTIDGIRFDSKKEAKRYIELKMLEKAGKIKELKLQPVFLLQEGFHRNGKAIRQITYRADFEYIDEKGQKVVEDVKGFKTDVYKLKKKLFLKKYPDLEFKEM
jgi:hypothetical protein